MANFSDNLATFLNKEGISIRALEQQIGCSNGVISRSINKGTDISSQWVSKIIETYPDLNPTWLLTGKGEMLKTKRTTVHDPLGDITVVQCKDTENQAISQVHDKKSMSTRPRIPLEAAAGSLSMILNSVTESQCEQLPVIPSLPRYDFTIIARGESMSPVIESGDELACRMISESTFIQWGRTHVLDTAQGIVVKRIFGDGANILCKSNNLNYPDFRVPKEDIYHMAIVVGLVRQF